MELSIISPVYKAQDIIQTLTKELLIESGKITDSFEIILVEDGSPDQSWETMLLCCEIDRRVKAIKLSRNFGQHNAIMAGLSMSVGKWVVVMDCDMQDRPDQIPLLYEKAKSGYDVVLAQRKERADSYLKRLSSRAFYFAFSYLTNTKQDSSIANFGIYSKDAIDAVLKMGDQLKFFPTMINWVGFKKTVLKIKHGDRLEGKSSYTLSKLLHLAFDNIISFSDKPLWLVIRFGFLLALCSFGVGLYFVGKYLVFGIPVVGYTSLIVSIYFLSGIIIFILGLLGIYIGKTFAQSKARPSFIVKEMVNYD